MKAEDLLTHDGRYDRPAIMVDARRQHRQMARHGWSWARCLKLAWAKAKAMRARLNADPDKVVKTIVRPTAEGVALLLARLTGLNVSAEEMADVADELAALEN